MADLHVGYPVLLLRALVLLSMNGLKLDAQSPWAAPTWTDAHATFYGGTNASGTMGGACGYGNLYDTGYGTYTAALSVTLFNNGLTCGACFQIECLVNETEWCYPDASITVTATNECPAGSNGGWCDQPKLHFDLSYPMFTALAQEEGGVIPIQYIRVPCQKSGGIIFTMNLNANPYFLLVLVSNVAGGGDVAGLQIKGDNSSWYTMTQNWGQNWELDDNSELVGQALSYQVTLGDGSCKAFYDVAPSYWSFGQSFQAGDNFLTRNSALIHQSWGTV